MADALVPARGEGGGQGSGRRFASVGVHVTDRSIRVRNPKVVETLLVGGQALLLHLDSGAYHELSPVGAEIWSLVDGQRTAAEVTVELGQRLEDPPDDLETIVVAFLTDLRERDLLT